MSYEAAKGRSRIPEEKSRIMDVPPAAAAALTERDRNLAAERAKLFKEHFPHAIEFFRGMYELGMVPGWRAIVRFDIKEKR